MLDVIAKYGFYITGAITLQIGLAEGILGLDIPGVVVGDDWLAYILGGFGLGGVGRALAKQVV